LFEDFCAQLYEENETANINQHGKEMSSKQGFLGYLNFSEKSQGSHILEVGCKMKKTDALET
jgi:hypothetical protein